MAIKTDFGEIAYIVCTVATPPTQDPSAFITTAENTLARLRKTERQFREASILAALDVEARQLFTFYKKVDITAPKDQKTLLLKFGYVLRTNTCTIAYKTAARLPDLLKPEQSRLYRLFITAIVSSIKFVPVGEAELQPLGPNLYLVEQAPSAADVHHLDRAKKWTLYHIDLQVVPSGQIILTIAKDGAFTFFRIRECAMKPNWNDHIKSETAAIYLAPIGRIARSTRSKILASTKLNGITGNQPSGETQLSNAQREVCEELLPSWLQEHMSTTIEAIEGDWIEIEIPVEEIDDVSNDSQPDNSSPDMVRYDSVTWRTIFWPARLCFVFSSEEPVAVNKTEGNQDPMQFVRDWILGTGSGTSKLEAERQNVMDEDDEPLFTDEGTFDDPVHFHPFGPPSFGPGQTIYPTPSEVGMTHLTPGFSSADGMAMTPANIPRGTAERPQPQDEDMPDFEDEPTASGLQTFYDEDLFEENPDDNLGAEANGDEPNWDFFDGPGIDPNSARATSHGRIEETAVRSEIEPGMMGVNDESADQGAASRDPAMVKGEVTGSDTAPKVSANSNLQQSQGRTEQPTTVTEAKSKRASQLPPKRGPPLWRPESAKEPTIGAERERRSSLYDGLHSLPSVSRHDSRYGAGGDYWFDPTPTFSNIKGFSKPNPLLQRPASSSSDSDSLMTSSSNSADPASTQSAAHVPFRQWTEYHPPSPSATNRQSEIDKNTIYQNVQQLLGFLRPGLIEPPTLSDFWLDNSDHRRIPPVSPQKLLQIAHVLVEQVSQTTLLPHGEYQRVTQLPPRDQMDVIVDLSGINTSAAPSSVFQLTNLKAEQSNGRVHGKVMRIQPDQIRIRRMERPLTASMSILNFWDSLNLQPENGPKDVTSFCIHPSQENVTEGCLSLLQRLAETYTSCSLGNHSIGRLPGITDTGSISWGPNDLGQHSLLQTCNFVGTALATSSDVKGTVLVCMIARNQSAISYLESCIAFLYLFESFTEARTDNQGVSDIALQVIPQNFVASAEALVIPPQTAYIQLAIEVYNRLPPSEFPAPPAACSSAVVLSKSENSVHLQLTPTYGSPLEKNGPCLHLAYSVSQDNRWLTAAWTDELGRVALSMSYCLRIRPSGKSRPRHDIFREMWDVSQDLMSKVRGPWRLAVVKHQYYDQPELLDWHQLFENSPTSQKRCLLVLLSVQLDPELEIFLPANQGKSAQTGAQNLYGTPASTPQGSMTSPEQTVPATPTPGGSSFMNAPTPSDPGFDPNNESDLILLDPSEESWGVILPFGINQTRSLIDLRPSQVTGYLMKRRGTKWEDGHNLIEFSLVTSTIHISNTSSETSPDELLEDLIKQYRGLVTLGATRGCVDPNSECLPWHIATAIRGAQLLGQAM
ncbi:uncharacterized protein Z520_05750 [Fonsecaea multimorphosa CBS 102226]|uniref:Mediator of RNA polymerase II transcription subunit 13 n=1 Tax=Fonsecaea multimorphosa CBS 102226 TaxID=1442371 RepID=A0A0D2K5M8_9EURO|nr:uncharacterized protein Z520_05750 [Fonsecaea multimorphosa CBS 102226]KIX98449.1 hypothetical protein Z520_05750 [Fonsecaea multimorphosa CBS 102226]OAL24644.1 hypothetical protein AYO22_05433 [Fonsecaea multimorphosa]